ncbi:Telomerase Cajal body protein 1 [Morella rubra]|uniref:Telomerase Cajal body protein 1 n=1 Tax=Morella rubra TaxID=262757 RepID=A0A6A1WDS6_9ROSI|nr:Telomerase Cajal body protein 1 [Morella rubra]
MSVTEVMDEEEENHQSSSPSAVADSTQPAQEEYSWPVIRYDVPPHRAYHFYHQFRTGPNHNNFLKGVKWSPDGSCFLTSSEDNTLRVFPLPDYGSGGDVSTCSTASDEDPVSCVFASTTRDHPIHLWDATSGELRCTYRAYDAMDEISAAFSVAFNPTGTKIFAGYNKAVRVFNLHRPGRDFRQHSTLQGNKEGLTGIISALDFCPTHTGLLAVGSYSQTTAIYREDNMELLYVLHGQEGGITHVQFSKDGNYLYTGGRKVGFKKPYRPPIDIPTRILFDIEPLGRHLGTGGQDGLVHLYDLQTGNWVSSFQAASDTVSGFSFHPYLPMAASSSGHRRYVVPDDVYDDMPLSGNENCASVWSFSVASTVENDADMNSGDFNSLSEHENQHEDPGLIS